MTEGRLGPAPVVHADFCVAGFLSVAVVVKEGVGRLVVAEPLAAVVFSRVLPERAGLITPAAGCDVRPTPGGWSVKQKAKKKGKKKE